MAKEKINLRDELRSYKFEFDLLQKIPCSQQENEEYRKILKETGVLPEGVFAYIDEINENGEESATEFYTVYESDLSDSEIVEYLTYKKLKLIKTIKNCVVFFTILTVISILASLIVLLFVLC